MKPVKRVAILFSPVAADANEDEKDSEIQMIEIRQELSSWGIDTVPVPFTLNLADVLKNLEDVQPDCVFNIVEAVGGHGRLVYLAQALLDVSRFPYTGADTNATFLTTNKLVGKSQLTAANIRTPMMFSYNDLKRRPNTLVKGQYIIKSVWEHASIGLGQDSIVNVNNASALMQKMSALQNRLSGECFAEAYIDGREFNLSMLGGPTGPQVLPPAEIVFVDYPANKFKILDYSAKWKHDTAEYTQTQRSFEFAESDAPLLEQLKSIALACWDVFGLRGYARVDFRVDSQGTPFVLEINTNPCLSKDAGFIAACARGGILYKDVLLRIIEDRFSNHTPPLSSLPTI